jgi:hypothetical protein
MAEVRLEGFSAPLKGQTLWVCGSRDTLGSQILNRLAALEEELLNRGRKVLIVQNQRDSSLRWTQQIQWDAQFKIRDAQDLRLAATYIQNALKPIRVVWIGDEPPLALMTAVKHSEITFLVGSVQNPRSTWNAIFWHPSLPQTFIEEGLTSRMGVSQVQKLNLSSVLRELKASEVGLVWSSIGETDKAGSIYWYDMEESETSTPFDPREAIQNLKEVSEFLKAKFLG